MTDHPDPLEDRPPHGGRAETFSAPDADGRSGVSKISAAELRDEGYLLEVNRRFFHPLGLALAVDVDEDRVEVLDDRLDPEGWYFADVGGPEIAKAENVARLEEERRAARMAALGYWIQPIPGSGS